MLNRRHFSAGLASLAFAGLTTCTTTPRGAARAIGYGPLVPDPAGLFDLPAGFRYRIISAAGETMDDGCFVPSNHDGMGAFPLDRDRTILVRNQELSPRRVERGAFRAPPPASLAAFDRLDGGMPVPGSTTTLIYNSRSGQVESQHLSLTGTMVNCAGGTTPWGSWLSCEESVLRAGEEGVNRDHGWVFEVPAGHRGLIEPRPLTAMGRFKHEAASVDPRNGIVYLTEDREDSLLYRFLPNRPGRLAEGGRLQALGFADSGESNDTRNWSGVAYPADAERPVRWLDLDNVESPEDDLRARGAAAGGAIFARGEGIAYGDGAFYFTCTSGGAAKLGQIMRYRPSRFEGQSGEAGAPGRLTNFVESVHPDMLNYGDNLIVAPHGHLIVCEDQYTNPVANYLRGVTPEGRTYPLAFLRAQTELAGVCFSGDGGTMFVNAYHPGKTLAVTGPWWTVRG